MQVEIDESARRVFHSGEALIEGPGLEQALKQRLGHRLTGPAVTRVLLQYLRYFQPMLVKLRGQFDEVAGYRGSRKQGIRDVRQHSVQRVAELVKQSARVIEGQQRGFPRRWLRKIANVHDDRAHIAGKPLLIAQRRRPGTAMLGRSGEIIADKERHVTAL